MKNLYLAFLLISSSFVSAQKLVVSIDQPLTQFIRSWQIDGSPIIDQKSRFLLPRKYIPGLNLSYYGFTANAGYVPGAVGFTWALGYTLTISPNVCLRAHGKGLQIGTAFGRKTFKFSPYYDPELKFEEELSFMKLSIAWQTSTMLYGLYVDVYSTVLSGYIESYGLRVGYAIL